MASENEILVLWKKCDGKADGADLKTLAEFCKMAKREGADEMGAALSSDENIWGALKTFGFGRRGKTSLITMRALIKEAANLAKEKMARDDSHGNGSEAEGERGRVRRAGRAF